MASGVRPGSAGSPNMVCVFPELVWPYANMVVPANKDRIVPTYLAMIFHQKLGTLDLHLMKVRSGFSFRGRELEVFVPMFGWTTHCMLLASSSDL